MRNLRDPVAFAAFVVPAYVVARFVGVAVHEVLGHVVLAFLMGGSSYAFYVSPGSGFAYVFLPEGSHVAAVVAVHAAGIAVELALAVALWARVLRTRSLPLRVFGLLLLEALAIQTLVYMAVSGFDFFPGDSLAVVFLLGRPALALGLLVVGIAWAVALAWVVSLEVVRALGLRDLRGQIGYVAVFWLAPIPLNFIPGFAAWGALAASLPVLVVVFAAATASLGYAVWWTAGARRGPPILRERRKVAALAVAAIAIVPVWIGAFGFTPDTATGFLVSEPPVEAERTWVPTYAANLVVTVQSDLNVTMEFRMRGLPGPMSPLQQRIWSSFDDRLDHAFWESQARFMATGVVNVSTWRATGSFIDGTAWAFGEDHPYARVVRLVSDPSRRWDILRNESGAILLTIHDPFKYEPPIPTEGFLDEVTIRWDAPLSLDHALSSGGTAAAVVIDGSVRWRSLTFEAAPETMQVYLRFA